MKSLKSEKLYISVYKAIKGYIIENKLGPNDKLPTEHEMCEMLGVSRNVLREAIKALEIIGIVKSTPSKGITILDFNTDYLYQNLFYYLATNNEETIREIMEIRKLLELGYMHLAFTVITDEEIQGLRNLVNTMIKKMEKGLPYREQDQEFHMLLFKNVDNNILNSILSSAWEVEGELGSDDRERNLSIYTRKHVHIVEALEKKDYPAFEKSMRDHFASDTFTSTKYPSLGLYCYKLPQDMEVKELPLEKGSNDKKEGA